MTVEELLRPRYKVIAKWPRGGFPVGLVFEGIYLNDLSKSVIECAEYPHLFKPLQWWQDRSDKELLGLFLKKVDSSLVTKVNPPISLDRAWFVWDNLKNSVPFWQWIPVTEQEYNDFKNEKK